MTYKEESGICTLTSQIERFTTERRYLKGVSPATENWYKYSLKAFMPVLSVPYQSTTDLRSAIAARIATLMAEGRGNRPVSINTYLRCLKAFLNWCHQEGIIEQCVKLVWLKEEEKVLETLTAEQIKRLIGFSPHRVGKVNRFGGSTEARIHTLACLLLDTGLRIAEALALTTEDVDFDDLVLKVHGKGGKQRLVPFSFEMRKLLWRYRAKTDPQSPRVFCTRNGTQLSQRDVLRDLKKQYLHGRAQSGKLRRGDSAALFRLLTILRPDRSGLTASPPTAVEIESFSSTCGTSAVCRRRQ